MSAVAGIFGSETAANLAYLAIFANQHRGKNSAGIATRDGNQLNSPIRGLGLVSHVFDEKLASFSKRLCGDAAIGHARQSTYGQPNLLENVQPIVRETPFGRVAIATDGHILNSPEIRVSLEKHGAIFSGDSDTQVIHHLMAHARASNATDALVKALRRVRGAYSIVCLTPDALIAARDPYGYRPLSLGRINEDTIVIASETCAFDLVNAHFERNIERGEVVIVTKSGVQSLHPFRLPTHSSHCTFEHVFYARPDSVVFGRGVDETRTELGRVLALESPVFGADLVSPIPDSGNCGAVGFADASDLPFQMGFIRSHYDYGTSIQRGFSPERGLKLNPVRNVLGGKSVVLVDDSIATGESAKSAVKMVWDCGAREVHLRFVSPPMISPCYYGVHRPNITSFVLRSHPENADLATHLGVNSVACLSLKGMLSVLEPDGKRAYCTSCVTGVYPRPHRRFITR
jgi:amidophosphoribosyltransferase